MSTEARTISFRCQIAIAISLSPDGNWPHNASSKIVSGMTIAEDQGRAPSCPRKVSCNEVPKAATPSKMPSATNLGSCAMSKFEWKLHMPDWKFHHRHRLAIKLTGFSGAGEHSDDSILYLPWRKLPSKRRREILLLESTSAEVRPIRSETRATLVVAIARGRRWLNELVTDAARPRNPSQTARAAVLVRST